MLLAPLFTIFYNLRALGNVWMLLLAVPLGTWAILINGTFFAALSIRSRNREMLLPLILFPIFMPALLAMVLAISAILSGDSDPSLWIKMLARLRRNLHRHQPAPVRDHPERRVRVSREWPTQALLLEWGTD